MSLIFCSADGKQCVQLSDNGKTTIEQDITRFHPLETGGILIGYYENNFRKAVVETALPAPEDSKHGKYSFERGTMGIEDHLRLAKEANPSLHYLGEWHSHPNSNPFPSFTDKLQMQEFAYKKLYGAPTPLLLIVGGTPYDLLKWHFTMHSFLRIPIYRSLL